MNATHPSLDIIGEESKALKGKRIVLGVTGSVAAYRSIDLARKLMRRGAHVRVVLTRDAADLVSPKLFHWATGIEPVVDVSGDIEHIVFAREYDGMVIAPATANTIAKLAHGIADTSVTLVALSMHGKGKPILIVPVMHLNMYQSTITRENIERLRKLGYHILEPVVEGDKAKIPSVEDIALKTEAMILRGEDLRGLRVLVTAGPTREHLDPVRFLSNPSSGRMGVAIAREAFFRGAKVTLIHGPLCGISPPPWIKSISITSTKEMRDAVLDELDKEDYDIIVFAAAPVDYGFAKTSTTKIDSSTELTVRLTPTPKIIADATRKAKTRKPSAVIVGFSAETVETDQELVERARKKLDKYEVDIIIANNVAKPGIGFASKYNEVLIVTKTSTEKIPKMTKEEIARIILDKALEILGDRIRRNT